MTTKRDITQNPRWLKLRFANKPTRGQVCNASFGLLVAMLVVAGVGTQPASAKSIHPPLCEQDRTECWVGESTTSVGGYPVPFGCQVFDAADRPTASGGMVIRWTPKDGLRLTDDGDFLVADEPGCIR